MYFLGSAKALALDRLSFLWALTGLEKYFYFGHHCFIWPCTSCMQARRRPWTTWRSMVNNLWFRRLNRKNKTRLNPHLVSLHNVLPVYKQGPGARQSVFSMVTLHYELPGCRQGAGAERSIFTWPCISWMQARRRRWTVYFHLTMYFLHAGKAQALDHLAETQRSNKLLEEAITLMDTALRLSKTPRPLQIRIAEKLADRQSFRGQCLFYFFLDVHGANLFKTPKPLQICITEKLADRQSFRGQCLCVLSLS